MRWTRARLPRPIANLSRLVIDPCREACKMGWRVGQRLALDIPFFVAPGVPFVVIPFVLQSVRGSRAVESVAILDHAFAKSAPRVHELLSASSPGARSAH